MGRRVLVFLLLLNVVVLLAGLALEYWRGQPKPVPAFNADKIRLMGVPQPAPAEGH